MSPFQYVALIAIGGLVLLGIVSVARGWVSRREAIIWTLVWIAAGVAIARPGLTQSIASRVGVGRGKDLVLYCAVLVMMVGFLMTYVRLRHLRHEMTLLVRHMAIRDAVDGSAASAVSRPVSNHDDPLAEDKA